MPVQCFLLTTVACFHGNKPVMKKSEAGDLSALPVQDILFKTGKNPT
ncbi:hypothetical protein HMPREF0083_02399 [Aneurinibacillus aneurinilyticus ATCC 12856]|uniref:Uncharacterized protein n=1 Tax=Aneurinibacillus aneurinilyticus ATCC 12856 TaxID=649747 RepID=U1X4U1_ANEAE|nr:hypothetical protein HMPREF0083_02399 [Aneurinibacillus aneurinilyticus ATCC 12856]